jgi:MFS family permease
VAKKGKAGLLIIFIVVFIDLLGFGIVLPLLPRYGKHFEADGLTLGLLMSSFSFMQFLFAPLWGRISDRVGRRPILILGLAGSTCSYALFGYATSLGSEGMLLGMGAMTWLFISRIGAGIAGATISTAQAYIADVTGKENRSRGMAMIGAAFGIGFTFGPLLGAMFVSDDLSALPSSMPGYIASAFSGLALIAAIFVLPESLKEKGSLSEHGVFQIAKLKKYLSQPVIMVMLCLIFLSTFSFAQFESTMSLLTKHLNYSEKSNFYLFAYIGLVLTLGQGLIVRRLLPKIGEKKMAISGVVLMIVGLLALAFVGQDSSKTYLYSIIPISVLGFSAISPSVYAMLSLNASENQQGEIMGLGQSVSAIARILGPIIGISLYFQKPSYPYMEAALVMVIGLFLIFKFRSQQEEKTDEPQTESLIDAE